MTRRVPGRTLSVERYASPTSARLWQQLRDAFGAASTGQPDRIYLSRSRQTARKLTNEAEVEALFRDFGFAIVHPEELSIDQQIALISNAVLIAGPGGSGMYNLAFQRRLKSVFLLISDAFMQLTEWLLLAGSTCTVCYHIGTRDMLARSSVAPGDAWRVDMATLTLDVASWLAKETASLSAPPLDTEGRSG